LRREQSLTPFLQAITFEIMRTNEKNGSRVGSGCVVCKVTTRTGEPL
jgi:hypothetical protein